MEKENFLIKSPKSFLASIKKTKLYILTIGILIFHIQLISGNELEVLLPSASESQSAQLMAIKENIINKFHENGVKVSCKEYPTVNSRGVFYKFEDNTFQPLNSNQKRLVLCEGKPGKDLLIYLNEKPQKKQFSGVHFSLEYLENHLRWLSWDKPSPDIIILPTSVITPKVREDIKAIDARLIEFKEEDFSPFNIANQLYNIIIKQPDYQ